MEDSKHNMPYSTEQVVLRSRHVPDVPEDVDFLMEHLNDPNMDLKKSYPPSMRSVSTDFQGKKIYAYDQSDYDAESQFDTDRPSSRHSTTIDFDDESPYPEVRAAVSSVDDPEMPVNTFRMWFIGIVATILVSGLNQFFSLRYPSVFVTGIVIQLVTLPIGKLFERILPTKRFNTFGYVWSLNPGPFTIKEHVCITVMANVVVGGAYATDVILTQRIFYHQQLSFGYQIMIVLSTQLIGYSMAGILRQFAVWPSSMIWPGALVNAALFNTLHKNYGKQDAGHISRERFFLFAFLASFVWYFVPGYLFTALSAFNWICWIAPNNVVVNALFGTSTGLGMSVLTFDWSMISYIGSPLVTPWWSELNTGVAFVIMFWLIVPIIYFTNAFNSAYFPISSFLSWDNTGAPYDFSAVVDQNVIFQPSLYSQYSPLFMSATLIVSYGAAFAAFPSVFVHTFLWFRKDIVKRFRSTLRDERDIHSRLMLSYTEVPMWWYGLLGAVCFILMCVGVEVFPTQLPAWAAFVGFVLSAILSIPLAMLMAITNQQVPTQVMHEMIAGYMLPGRPIANVLFKTIAFIGTSQALSFAGDLKLGHYMKIPPRVMFSVQVAASVISCFVVTATQDWMLANIEDICTPHQKNGFSCPSTNVFATASLVWGGIGPKRMFAPGAPYNPIMYFFLVGALLPIPFYILARRFPLSIWRYVNIPIFFAGLGAIPPASGINYMSWVLVGFLFNYVIRKFRFRWWMRYNYILSAALDSGVAISMIVIFFCLQFPKGGINLDWWGNTVAYNNADANGIPFKPIPSGQTVGPATWS
ncbi:hypothetical protein NP233_g1653 [Leucocoprinus birnbaumii]|uniref:OPT oligopeptide transporter n=1 Tax=Leucocoprinus birnbaumii TaxID=56174 RepID=A0AAD5W5D5_9AGAR|nr:hypothetical protein NP233_g1653 [Leucocoprinus birnbaumii]